ncbi:MAG: CDP-alcohol phosphatidyltransferase family protein [Chloroflexota bacterium]
MFPAVLQRLARRAAEAVVSPLARSGVSPNAVTLAGFIFNLITAAVIATNNLRLGGVLLLLSGLFDMLDGALARVSRRQSRFGAFLDSLLDRYSEAAILLALIYLFATQRDVGLVVLTFVVSAGSLLISYGRARAEGLGLTASVGIAPRPERVVILGIGLLLGGPVLVAALAVLAVLAHVTVVQRLYHVWLVTRIPPEPNSGAVES